jgi:hypothetical protein
VEESRIGPESFRLLPSSLGISRSKVKSCIVGEDLVVAITNLPLNVALPSFSFLGVVWSLSFDFEVVELARSLLGSTMCNGRNSHD